jgi:hypothetical protein
VSRAGRLRFLVNTETWADINSAMVESVNSLVQAALAEDDAVKAIEMFKEARIAQTLVFKLTRAVENTAEQGE